MSELHVVVHPFISQNLAQMREATTSPEEFRRCLKAITTFLGYEATRNLPMKSETITTPITDVELPVLKNDHFAIVAIIRAGIGMLDGMLELMPSAAVGFVGMQRDEITHEPNEYYLNLPEGFETDPVFIVDPMLATGGSAIDAIKRLKQYGCTNITFICLLAAPEGVAAFHEAHPDIDIYTAALDERLNDAAYIVPGLGDAGDRIFNTIKE